MWLYIMWLYIMWLYIMWLYIKCLWIFTLSTMSSLSPRVTSSVEAAVVDGTNVVVDDVVVLRDADGRRVGVVVDSKIPAMFIWPCCWEKGTTLRSRPPPPPKCPSNCPIKSSLSFVTLCLSGCDACWCCDACCPVVWSRKQNKQKLSIS